MDFLKLKLGNDAFDIMFEYYDPIKTAQIERKKVIDRMFKILYHHAMKIPTILDGRTCWIRYLRQFDEGSYITNRSIDDSKYKKRNKGVCPLGISILYKRQLFHCVS